MQILFIWFEKYKALKNFQTNLGGKYHVHFDNKDILTLRDNDIYIEEFFKSSIESNNIDSLNISAIVGENGSGKSTIIDFLVQLMLDQNKSDYIIIYSQNGKIYKDYRFINTLYLLDQTRGGVTVTTKNFYNSNHLTMFFSNVFDVRFLNTNFSNDSEEFVNISTNALLSRHENVKDFMYEELQRQIFFINKHNKNFKINQVIELPTKIKIENSDNINFTEISWELSNYGEINIFNSNQFANSKSFRNNFVLNFLSSYIIDIKNTFHEFKNEIKIKELLRLVSTSLKVAKNEKDFFNVISKEIIKKATELYLELRFSEEINRLSNDYLELYNLFIKLEVEFHMSNELDFFTGEEIVNEYIEIESTLSQSEKFINFYIEKFSNSNFLKFSWLQMSSGQFSFLTLFSRFSYGIEELPSEKKYNFYLLLIDEGDLYFHPQLQKDWLYHFIKIVDTIFTGHVQVILTTHSPFVLSDMPNTNVTFLSKDYKLGKNYADDLDGSPRTFAANISELLSNSFFIKEGLIGKFAKEKVNESIRWLLTASPTEVYKNREELIKFIDLIGEPLLRNKIYDIYKSKLNLFEAKDLSILIDIFQEKINELKDLSFGYKNDRT